MVELIFSPYLAWFLCTVHHSFPLKLLFWPRRAACGILRDPKQISGGLGVEGGKDCKGARGTLGGEVGILCGLTVVVVFRECKYLSKLIPVV